MAIQSMCGWNLTQSLHLPRFPASFGRYSRMIPKWQRSTPICRHPTAEPGPLTWPRLSGLRLDCAALVERQTASAPESSPGNGLGVSRRFVPGGGRRALLPGGTAAARTAAAAGGRGQQRDQLVVRERDRLAVACRTPSPADSPSCTASTRSDGWFGLPVFAKLIHACATLSWSAIATGPPPVAVLICGTLSAWKQKASSEQWNDVMPPLIGYSQAKT